MLNLPVSVSPFASLRILFATCADSLHYTTDYDFEYDPPFSIVGHVDASFVSDGSGQAASPPFEDQGVPSCKLSSSSTSLPHCKSRRGEMTLGSIASKGPFVETEPVVKTEESSPLADWTLAEDAVLLSTLFVDSSFVKSWNDVRSMSEKTFVIVEGGVFVKSANECAARYYNALKEIRVGGERVFPRLLDSATEPVSLFSTS